MDFINKYMPAPAELTQEELYSTRERLATYCKTVAPDVETNPNSVVGDLIVTPQAYVISAIEKGLDRLMEDMDLANVAAGNVNNCDFVAKWLDNFAVDVTYRLRASGVVRLTFSSNLRRYVLDRHTRITIGSDIYSLYLPNLGAYTIYRPGEKLPVGVNGTVAIDTGSGTYFADIVVVGEITNPDGTTPAAGTAATLSESIPELVTAAALIDFDPGAETISVPDLAKRARTTMHSASLNTRNGAINYVNMICPFLDGIYAVHNGDREMLRDYDNPFASSIGCLDLYVRSKGYNFTERQQLRLYLNINETAFEGNFPYVGQPYHIESVTHEDLPELENIPHIITSTFTPLPGTATKYPGAIAAYTPHEKLYISIDDVTDELGDSKFNPKIDTDGRRYTTFTITYQTDPMLREICQTVENEDYRPINTSILVRGFIPVIIEQFEVVYVRQPGVLPDLDTAFTKIKEYMGNLGAPDMFSEAEIAHIMLDYGVKYTKGINVRARVQWVVGDQLQNRAGKIVKVKDGPWITTAEGLRIVHPDENIDLTADSMYACSPRNIRYWFMEGSLTFKEVRDI